MDKKAIRERWQTMIAQAERLAETDNFIDAVARAQRAHAELSQTAGNASGADRAWLEKDLYFCERELARLEAARDAWHAGVEARRNASVERERRIYDEPLAVRAR
ncbi:MAG: hypothetical protein R3A78_12790 [Polyangiales bacterium]